MRFINLFYSFLGHVRNSMQLVGIEIANRTYLQLSTIFTPKEWNKKHERKNIRQIYIINFNHFYELLLIDTWQPLKNKAMDFMNYQLSFFYNFTMQFKIYQTYIMSMFNYIILMLNLYSLKFLNVDDDFFVFFLFLILITIIQIESLILVMIFQHYSFLWLFIQEIL